MYILLYDTLINKFGGFPFTEKYKLFKIRPVDIFWAEANALQIWHYGEIWDGTPVM